MEHWGWRGVRAKGAVGRDWKDTVISGCLPRLAFIKTPEHAGRGIRPAPCICKATWSYASVPPAGSKVTRSATGRRKKESQFLFPYTDDLTQWPKFPVEPKEQRPFDIRSGMNEDGFTVPKAVPAEWPEPLRNLWNSRMEAIKDSPELRLIEDPHYKRRWIGRQGLFNQTKRQDELLTACEAWLLDRLESYFDLDGRMNDAGKPTSQVEVSLVSTAKLADIAGRDSAFQDCGRVVPRQARLRRDKAGHRIGRSREHSSVARPPLQAECGLEPSVGLGSAPGTCNARKTPSTHGRRKHFSKTGLGVNDATGPPPATTVSRP